MTAPNFSKKNPLTVTELCRYRITERGPITESLDILAALKAAQSRFRRRILRRLWEDINPDLRQGRIRPTAERRAKSAAKEA